MKICKNCKVEKLDSEFYKGKQTGKNGQTWNYLDSLCKNCRKTYANERRKLIKQQAINYLGGKCFDCGLIDIPEVYDFHHKDPSKKDFTLAKRNNRSFKAIQKELDKCILLCAICHRKRHAKDL